MLHSAFRRASTARTSQRDLLFVEPVTRVVELMRDDLELAGFRVHHAADGPAALTLLEEVRVDVVILDSVLPGMSGLRVLRLLQIAQAVPVVWLTRRTAVKQRRRGLEAGASQCLAMPFGSEELVRSVQTATSKSGPTGDIRLGSFELVEQQCELRIDGQLVPLGRAELMLARAFLRNPGRVLRRSDLVEPICGPDFAGSTRAVDNTVMSLCHKLGEHGRRIETVWGVGYRFLAAA